MEQNPLMNVMALVNAAREEMICPEGHFHPEMSAAEMLVVLANDVAVMDAENARHDEDSREVTLLALAHIAQVVRSMFGETDQVLSTEDVMKRLHLEYEGALPYIAMAIGLRGTLPGSDKVH